MSSYISVLNLLPAVAAYVVGVQQYCLRLFLSILKLTAERKEEAINVVGVI